jgi:hypothetical protein
MNEESRSWAPSGAVIAFIFCPDTAGMGFSGFATLSEIAEFS